MEYIDINDINVDNEYLRLDSNVEKLKKSIETVGLINPLVLNNDNKLIAGGRRYSALKELEYTEVPVIKINKTELEQELISIDENLIRLDLKNMELEKSLSRGREIYEEIYPEALKFENEDLVTPAQNEIHADLPNNKRSYIDLTAEKTGLSKKVIKGAIEREERASDSVKKLRSHGELNASQTNELIKLEKQDQEKISGLVHGKSAKEIKEIVKRVRETGAESTINEILTAPNLPSEFKSLKTLITRTNKVMSKILFEQIQSSHPEAGKVLQAMTTLRLNLDQFVELCAKDNIKESRVELAGDLEEAEENLETNT
jgi:ParB family chromosome partitioning protein